MDNLKNDKYYLEKIIADLAFIAAHTSGKSKEEFESNELLIDSVMFRLIQIAENNSKLSEQFKSEHKNVPWLAIRGMRNRIVHDYGVVDLSVIYDTVIYDIPEMYKLLSAILLCLE